MRRATTSVPRMSGSGAYNMKDIKTALKPVLREALANGGAALGGLTGMPHGAIFGRELGKKISKIVGSGDYQTNTSVNALIQPPGGAASASFGEDGTTIRLRRREFVADMLAPATPGTFFNTSFAINAGSRETFPFLSQIASNYEEYCFDGLVFEFISSSSPYTAATALGTVIAAMQYNASSPDYLNKYTMENSAAAISTRIDKNLMYGVECAKGSNAQNCYYVRSGSTTLPLTTTDLGKFELAFAPASTIAASTVLGELWVTYDVCLKRPVLEPSRWGYYRVSRSGVTTAAPFGTAYLKGVKTAGANYWTLATSSTMTFADAVVGDSWMLTFSVVGTVVTAAAPTVGGIDPASPGITASNFLTSTAGVDTVSFVAGGRNGAVYLTGGTTLTVTIIFTTTATSGTLIWNTAGNANWPTGTVYCDLILTSLGNGLTTNIF